MAGSSSKRNWPTGAASREPSTSSWKWPEIHHQIGSTLPCSRCRPAWSGGSRLESLPTLLERPRRAGRINVSLTGYCLRYLVVRCIEKIRLRFRSLALRSRVDDELDDELGFHLEQ